MVRMTEIVHFISCKNVSLRQTKLYFLFCFVWRIFFFLFWLVSPLTFGRLLSQSNDRSIFMMARNGKILNWFIYAIFSH